MKKGLAFSAVVVCSLSTLYASGWDTSLPPEHKVGRLELASAPAEIDSFGTYVYAANYMMIFSYESDNECKVYDNTGSLFWSKTLQKDKYAIVDCPDSGLYWISAVKGISVLSGDGTIPSGMGSWFAIDPFNNPLSTKFLSMGPGVKPNQLDEQCLIIFSYQDDTHVSLRKIPEDSLIWDGDLDSAAIYRWDTQGKNITAVLIEASYPVSVLTCTFAVSFSPPSFNGTFTGTDFMSYANYGHYPQDLQVIPWEDSTNVKITELGNPSNVIWEAFCEKRGEIKGTLINDNTDNMGGVRRLFIHSDKDISVCQSPWVSFDEPFVFNLIEGVDNTGSGLGKEFFLPLLTSLMKTDFFPSKLYVLSFKNNNAVQVRRIPKNGGADTLIWEGSLNKGEYYEYTCPMDYSGDRAIYHVVASDTVVTLGGFLGNAGFADFFPVLHWEKPGGALETRGAVARMEIANPIGCEIVLKYSNCPHGLEASVYDASGQKVDEIQSTQTQGTLQWGAGHGPGVYFIRTDLSNSSAAKVVMIK